MPCARLRSSATASRAPPSSSSSSSRSGESAGRPSRSSRSPTASATRCCWAPSCRSRSIRRRSAVAAATIRARDACSSALLVRRSTRVAWSASSRARLRSSIASLPATAASARSSAPVNAAASAARSITTSASTRLPSTAGAKRICGGSGVGGHQPRQPHPQPAGPGHADAGEQAALGRRERDRRAGRRRAGRARSSRTPGRPRPACPAGPSRSARSTAASRGASTRPAAAAARPPARCGGRGRRRRRAARRASAARPRAPRGCDRAIRLPSGPAQVATSSMPSSAGFDQVELRADREPAEGQQHEQQPEVDGDGEAREVRRRDQDRGARPPGPRARGRRRPEHDRQQRERHRHGERRPAAEQRDAHPDRRDPQPDDHPRQEQRPRRPPPREQVHCRDPGLDAPVAHPHDPARARRHLRAVGDHEDRLATGVQLPEEVEHLRGARGVERARRLVGQQQRGPVGQRAGDRDALALPARQPRGQLTGALQHAEPVEQLAGPRERVLPRAPPTSAASATFSSAVRCSIRWKNWNTRPTCRRRRRASAAAPSPSRRAPAISMLPSSAGSSPASTCSSVDLPQPDGPIRATSSPRLDHEVDAAQRADRGGLRVERPPQPTGDQDRTSPTSAPHPLRLFAARRVGVNGW